ncbi:MAG: hypothetical protein UW92_C0029G0002 [Candidatus Jorgensenbacteria bacterium GW2011_GWA2_45_13]|uniref:Uncharacterized protein n=1 Tax=Candidatus Jorgensenbacteria bacterium GW2011_GWA2_45_13 TaxID=1618662 RepID=A0A0G1L4P4_9BACT|nr:MAG: hypothetical protein UW92_C0029G0002 [Candidatus Jorgensenbacteria bacterium GW2011_GWA2_45_13]
MEIVIREEDSVYEHVRDYLGLPSAYRERIDVLTKDLARLGSLEKILGEPHEKKQVFQDFEKNFFMGLPDELLDIPLSEIIDGKVSEPLYSRIYNSLGRLYIKTFGKHFEDRNKITIRDVLIMDRNTNLRNLRNLGKGSIRALNHALTEAVQHRYPDIQPLAPEKSSGSYRYYRFFKEI